MEVMMEIMVGDASPSPALMKKLGLPKSVSDLITDAYKYGKLGVLQGKDLSKMSKIEVEKLMKDIKLTPSQKSSIDFIKSNVETQIQTTTQRIINGVISVAVQSDLAMWDAVGRIVPNALENNTPRYQVIQQLREYTNNWERDWHRVAHTEMWSAKVNGEAQSILNNESPLSSKGSDTLVFKRPSPLACNKCKQLYLEKDGKTPRVFKLSEMMSYGTNYGKKQADWKPVVGVMHPNCMCPLSVMPDNSKFDDNGNLVLDF